MLPLIGLIVMFFLGMLMCIPAMMSPMLFDAPGSAKKKKLWMLLGCVVLSPFVLFSGFGYAVYQWLHNDSSAAWSPILYTFGMYACLVVAIIILMVLEQKHMHQRDQEALARRRATKRWF